MVSTFKWVHRTRLFDARWTVVSAWASASISWVTGFLRKKFRVEVKKSGTVVVVLSQLDDRYFVGLEGQYYFELHFVLQREGEKDGEHVCGARQVHKWENRSISCEVDLEAGVYEVVPKITSTRRSGGVKSVEEMVQKYAEENPQKVRQVGTQYDLAHAKPGVSDYDLELEEEKEKAKKKEEKKKEKEKAEKKKEKEKLKKLAKKAKAQKKKALEKMRKEREMAKKEKARQKRNADRQKRREAKEKKKEENEDGEKKVSEEDPKTDDATQITVEVKPEIKPKDGSFQTPEAEPAPENESEKPEGDATPFTPLSEVAPDTPIATEPQVASVPPPASDVSSDEEAPSIPSDSEPELDSDSDSSCDDDEEDDEDEEEDQKDNQEPPPNNKTPDNPPWNPVCVLGLRVYACDPDVSVTLVEVKDEKITEPVGATS